MDSSVITPPAEYPQELSFIFALVLGGLIVPLVEWLKRFSFVGGVVDVSFVTAAIAIAVSFPLAHWLAPQMTSAQVLQFGVAALGGATVMYRGLKIGNILNGGSK
jgi:ABC-type phosphate/phosphonate transport system permease subunit